MVRGYHQKVWLGLQFSDGGEDLAATSMANVQVSYNSGSETAKLSSTDIVASNLVTVGSDIKSNASVYVKGYSTSVASATQYTLPGLHITSEQGSVRAGIGTTLPTSTLTVNGEVSATSYSGAVNNPQTLTGTPAIINFTGIGENSGDFSLSNGEVTVTKAGSTPYHLTL